MARLAALRRLVAPEAVQAVSVGGTPAHLDDLELPTRAEADPVLAEGGRDLGTEAGLADPSEAAPLAGAITVLPSTLVHDEARAVAGPGLVGLVVRLAVPRTPTAAAGRSVTVLVAVLCIQATVVMSVVDALEPALAAVPSEARRAPVVGAVGELLAALSVATTPRGVDVPERELLEARLALRTLYSLLSKKKRAQTHSVLGLSWQVRSST